MVALAARPREPQRLLKRGSAVATTAEKRTHFRALHESGCFAIPNPWNVGSAQLLQHLGFQALATTSSGFAWSQGRPDNGVPRDVVLGHVAAIAAATDLPVNADFENGHAIDAAGVGESVRLCVETGVAGLSIEDSTGDPANPLFDLPEAVKRLSAARKAIDAGGSEVLLTGRAENFIAGRPDLDDTIRRLKAYAEAGADCLYAPGIRTPEQIAAVVEAVAPKPVNLLVGGAWGLTMADIAALGVRRVSVGGALAATAWAAVIEAATGLAEAGSFEGFRRPKLNMNALFAEQ
ncbi:MAG: isocitrate lyase/phosphoenolpyruvate mutase family protein [Chloroflexi bacterium]|nr:isocitrate lyase/phosphoenolpyruvate mutase family protein [Chloroflexota bacterium]